jgi:hypothetical protein
MEQEVSLDDMQIGLVVPGTYLKYLRPLPRKSPKDRNAMGLFECVAPNCGNVKPIRIAYVRPGHTISCSCVGSELYRKYKQKRAANHIPPNSDPKRQQEMAIDAEIEAAVAREQCIYELWRQMFPDKLPPFPWSQVQMETMPGWTGGWMTPQECKLVDKYWRIVGRVWKARERELQEKARREDAYPRYHGGFVSEEQRQLWLRSPNPRDRLEARAAGWGESARIAKEELNRQIKEEGGFTNEMLEDPNVDVEIG